MVHLPSKHAMSAADYRVRHRNPETGEDPPIGYTVVQGLAQALAAGQPAYDTPPEKVPPALHGPAFNMLSVIERATFTDRFKTLYWQADEDPALRATVENIVLGEIHIGRYNEQISRLTQRLASQNTKTADIAQLNLLSKLVKDTQSTNLSLMQSLSITRDQKQKNRKVIESTPSRLVSAFETMFRNVTGDVLRRVNQEMDEAAHRLQRNLTALKPLVQTDVVLEGELDDEDTPV